MRGRLGTQAALTATAHKLARIVYLALKHGMTYVRQSQQEYLAQMREKQIKALRRKARQLGLEIVEKPSDNTCTGRVSLGAGIKAGKRISEVAGRMGRQKTRKNSPSDRSVAVAGESARPEEPGRKTISLRETSWLREVPCNRRPLATLPRPRWYVGLYVGPMRAGDWCFPA
jgi:hypothetical protein